MVNTEKFGKRLQKILEFYDLSAAAFADEIEVGRSSISHILSGRNKPSLDFVMKVVKSFPEVELYWLLNGKGEFPSKGDYIETTSPPSTPQVQKPSFTEPVPTQKIPVKHPVSEIPKISASSKEIRKIVIFYVDGSFEAFEN